MVVSGLVIALAGDLLVEPVTLFGGQPVAGVVGLEPFSVFCAAVGERAVVTVQEAGDALGELVAVGAGGDVVHGAGALVVAPAHGLAQ